jgi:hypothetical protein
LRYLLYLLLGEEKNDWSAAAEPDGSGQYCANANEQSPLTNLHAQPTGVSVCYWVSFFLFSFSFFLPTHLEITFI